MTFIPAIICSAAVAASPAADSLYAARQALRDGLWDVVRIQTENVPGDEARLMALESYAREGRWDDVLGSLDSWKNCNGEAFRYYRAAALAEKRGFKAALEILDKSAFNDPLYKKLAERLRAMIAAGEGDFAAALKHMESSSVGDDEWQAQMYMAELKVTTGDGAGAKALWHKVLANTNADLRAQSVAASNVGDIPSLKRVYSLASPAFFKRKVGLELGVALLKDVQTMDEGVKLIRDTVKDSPDAEGACEAYLAVADLFLSSSRWREAGEAYGEALEIWPELSRRSAFNLARGTAWMESSEPDKALAAFKQAFITAVTDEERAAALVKRADALARSGKEDEAHSVYREAVEKFPETGAAASVRGLVEIRELERRGRSLYREFRFEEAQKVFESVASADPTRKSRMDYLQVLCLYGRGLDDQAEAGARALAEKCEESSVAADAVNWLAKYCYNRGKWSESSGLFLRYAEMQAAADRKYEAMLWSARASFAGGDFKKAIQTASVMISDAAAPAFVSQALMVQGEALIELARFDEAVLIFGRVLVAPGASPADCLRARLLRADALFALGADNPACYKSALEAYRGVLLAGDLGHDRKLVVSFKVARTLDKMKLTEEAIDQYYTHVVLEYRKGRLAGKRFSDEARAVFSRAAFTLADAYEARGRDSQARRILKLVAQSDVPAAKEARRRIKKISAKGGFL